MVFENEIDIPREFIVGTYMNGVYHAFTDASNTSTQTISRGDNKLGTFVRVELPMNFVKS